MSDVTPIRTTPTGLPGISRAEGVRAGPWLFFTGHLAGDLVSGVSEAVDDGGLPYHGYSRHRREGDAIIGRFRELLATQGADLGHAVRLDQYYPSWKAVDPYHQARKASFGAYIPPSTSVLMDETLIPGCGIDVSLLAVTPESGLKPRRVDPTEVPVPQFSAFVPAVAVGDYVFVAGQMANAETMDALDPRSTKPAKALWNGTEIRLQTEFLIKHRLEPALVAAGSSLKNAVKAQIYLSDIADTADCLDVWNRHFGESPCAVSVVPTAGFGFVDGIIEINILGVRDDGAVRKEIVEVDLPRGAAFGPAAVKAGDLLCLSGLVAAGDEGPLVAAETNAALRYVGGGAALQMREILAMAERICEAGGTKLGRVVRAHHFLLDLHDFPATQYAWKEAVGDRPLPSGAVGVPGPMPVPGCTIMLDMWAYV